MNALINNSGLEDSEEDSHSSVLPSAFAPQETLLRLATANLYRQSPFRTLGVPVDATTRGLSRQIERIKLEMELGTGVQHKVRAIFPGRPLDHDTLHDCVQLLREPIARFVFEYFWFWPQEWMPAEDDEALRYIDSGKEAEALDLWLQREKSGELAAVHNLAVFFHLRAIETHSSGMDETPWRESYRRWRPLADLDEYWDFLAQRIRTINEPQVTLGLLRGFRATLPIALAKIGLEMAINDCEHDNFARASEIVDITKEGPGYSSEWWQAVERVSQPLRQRVDHAVDRARETTKFDQRDAPSAIDSLVQASKGPLSVLEMFYGSDSEELRQLSDSIVTTAINAGVTYQKETGDNSGFLAILEATGPFKSSKGIAAQLYENQAIARGNLSYASFIPPLESAIAAARRSAQSARNKLRAMRRAPFAQLARIQQEAPADIYAQGGVILAAALRQLSVEAVDDEGDFKTATEAITCAMSVAKDDRTATEQLAEVLAHIERSRPVTGSIAARISRFIKR